MRSLSLYSALFIALFFSPAVGVLSYDENQCFYSIIVKTGGQLFAGTDSKISLTLKESSGRFSVYVPDLTSWGAMPSGHDYFERNNVDVFNGRAPCICTPLCYLKLTSDGEKGFHGWYVDYLNATILNTSTNNGGYTSFTVDQWLINDTLTAVVNLCNATTSLEGGSKQEKNKRFAVGRLKLDDKSAAS